MSAGGSAAEPFMIRADAVAAFDPALPAVVRDGGVVVQGERIAAVGSAAELRGAWGKLPERYVAGLVMPALVNAHTHLELSYVRSGELAREHFTQWVAALMASYPPAEKLPEVIGRATRAGIAASLEAGVATVGDISRQCGLTRAILAEGPLRCVSFGEITALGKMRGRLEPMLAAAADERQASEHVTIGVSPHAPYTVEGPALERIVKHAVAHGLPVAMHLAELAEEEAFLRDLSGPLGREWDVMLKMDILDGAIPTCAGGAIVWAKEAGLLEASRRVPVVLAHGNYCSDGDVALLADARASVVYCPRTHAYFGHAPRHRYREMREAGINVALGTDSLASNPDLSPLEEARLLRRRDGVEARVLLEMITVNGARALGLGESTGTLAAGKRADVACFVMPAEGDVLARLLETETGASGLYIAGRQVR